MRSLTNVYSHQVTKVSVADYNQEMDLKYYPNPTRSVLTIENPAGNINSIKVVSMLGRVLFTNEYNNAEAVQLDMSSFSKGTYFVTINESKVIKILKD
ncbi:T9SS type A sorting domain-containing protein [Brumimicrobium glaciale]|uniref:T9SS type A sorting domain-containing protein n=1 Tax=Brumimicrobium glaciale TaxID=200475 RepID=A0A4Q4KHW5_9FLAO|nr:T9SS type A sorting domain-containing protein [Brumimicrobium glaciale]RYM32792.1 T9SS type A sorting domain-containing protein [Brumimicrobium glaciale]